jgi:hypothetical protein
MPVGLDLQPGLVLGTEAAQYELVAPAGAGGFSEVWRARRVGAGDLVALKVPRVPDLVEHLRREASLGARVSDPQVVPIIEAALEHDPPYLVMPWVEGPPIALDDRAPEPRDQLAALLVALDLARALERLHALGVAHGDLKPSNVLVVDGQVRILDLGLGAVQVETRLERSLAQSVVSVDGRSIAGTLDYMAPELFSGAERPRGATPAADIYALGVLLHHQLTGRPPAFGVAPATLNAFLPPGTEELLRRMLRQDPAQRASARVVARALARLVADERRCLARRNGHQRRRVWTARMRTLQRGLRGLVTVVLAPLLGVGAAMLATRMPGALHVDVAVALAIASVPLTFFGLIPLTLGMTTINAWLLGVPERTYKERQGHPWWTFMMQ